MTEKTHEIWKPDTGITDIEGSVRELAASEIPGIKAVWSEQKDRLKGTRQLSDFTERLSREWAIETGVIENLYEIDRGVTQTLIERGFHTELLTHGSTNKPKEYVLKLLQDQKDALEGVFDFAKSERELSTSYIKELHSVLLRSQETTEGLDPDGRHVDIQLIRGKWKERENYPTRDGVRYSYCPPEHVSSEMDRLIELHSSHVRKNVPSEVQAAWLHHRFTQIHPFQDGNGRVARALTSLVLVKDDLFPLVIIRDDKLQYIRALEEADRGDLKSLVDQFVRSQAAQFRKASAIGEAILVKEGVQAALKGFLQVADKVALDRMEAFKSVFKHAADLEEDLVKRLDELVPTISEGLKRVADGTDNVFVSRSTDQTDHYYRSQIIDNAKNQFEYYADTSEYRSWVSLNMHWSRRGKLVFTVHGIGKPFNGSLICSPFLEFKDVDKDVDDEDEARISMVPVAEEGFVFFYNEETDRLLARFRKWREDVLNVFVKELTQNL